MVSTLNHFPHKLDPQGSLGTSVRECVRGMGVEFASMERGTNASLSRAS